MTRFFHKTTRIICVYNISLSFNNWQRVRCFAPSFLFLLQLLRLLNLSSNFKQVHLTLAKLNGYTDDDFPFSGWKSSVFLDVLWKRDFIFVFFQRTISFFSLFQQKKGRRGGKARQNRWNWEVMHTSMHAFLLPVFEWQPMKILLKWNLAKGPRSSSRRLFTQQKM